MHISDNKHEFNLRRVEELTLELENMENKLKEEKNFFKKFKIRRIIRKIKKQLKTHNDEIILYEQSK